MTFSNQRPAAIQVIVTFVQRRSALLVSWHQSIFSTSTATLEYLRPKKKLMPLAEAMSILKTGFVLDHAGSTWDFFGSTSRQFQKAATEVLQEPCSELEYLAESIADVFYPSQWSVEGCKTM